MPYDENGEWIEEEEEYGDEPPGITVGPQGGGAYSGFAPGGDQPPGPTIRDVGLEFAQQTAEPGRYQGPPPQMLPEDRGGITPVIVHGEGGPAEYNGRMYYGDQAASSARALDVHRNQTPEQRQMLAQQQQQQQPPPADSIAMQEQIDRTSLSRHERLELTTTQNGLARLERDARAGLIPPAQAMQMRQQLQERAQPLMIRQSQLHGMMLAQQYMRNDEQAKQRSRMEAEHATFMAAHAQGSTIEHRDSTGRVFARSIVGPDGKLQTINNPEPRPAAGGAGGSRSGGGAANDHFDQTYTQATRVVDQMLAAPETSEADRARLRTPEGRRQAIEQEMQERTDAHERFSARDHSQRTRLPGGPLPFDPDPPGRTGPRQPQRVIEVGFRNEIQAAMNAGQRNRETRLRNVASDYADQNGDTGWMSAENQEVLQELGYYRNDFTPSLDRAINAAVPPTNGPNPMATAAKDFRQLLAAFGGRPPEARVDERRRFDELRGRLGFTTWPPPRQTAAPAPARPAVRTPPPPRPFVPDPLGHLPPGLPNM